MNKDEIIEQFKTMTEEEQRKLVKVLDGLKETDTVNKKKAGENNGRSKNQT